MAILEYMMNTQYVSSRGKQLEELGNELQELMKRADATIEELAALGMLGKVKDKLSSVYGEIKPSMTKQMIQIGTLGVATQNVACNTDEMAEHVANKITLTAFVNITGKSEVVENMSAYSSKKSNQMCEKLFPNTMQMFISNKDIKMTHDGYFVCTKSLRDILVDAGVDLEEDDFNNQNYDDWYITGVIGADGKITYSMIKIREPMDIQDRKGAAVPFVEMDMDIVSSFLCKSYNNGCSKMSEAEISKFKKTIYNVTNAADNQDKYSKEVLHYFKNPKSQGSYLIADIIAEKVAQNDAFKDGKYKLPYKFEEFDKKAQKTLLELEKKGVYNHVKNEIYIKNRKKLSEDEKNALLLITTGDSDAYAYAAENTFHADYYSEKPSLLENELINKSAIVSDAGVGESALGKIYESTFKEPGGKYYDEQLRYH